jgi:hypothetical protein
MKGQGGTRAKEGETREDKGSRRRLPSDQRTRRKQISLVKLFLWKEPGEQGPVTKKPLDHRLW